MNVIEVDDFFDGITNRQDLDTALETDTDIRVRFSVEDGQTHSMAKDNFRSRVANICKDTDQREEMERRLNADRVLKHLDPPFKNKLILILLGETIRMVKSDVSKRVDVPSTGDFEMTPAQKRALDVAQSCTEMGFESVKICEGLEGFQDLVIVTASGSTYMFQVNEEGLILLRLPLDGDFRDPAQSDVHPESSQIMTFPLRIDQPFTFMNPQTRLGSNTGKIVTMHVRSKA